MGEGAQSQSLVLAAGGVLVAVVFLFLAAVVGIMNVVAGGTKGVSAQGRTLLWVPLVRSEAQTSGIPSALELGVIEQGSGGNYLAASTLANGTTSAGLGQINSGPPPADQGWATAGLAKNPDDPAKNVAASVQMLAADIDQNNGDISQGLGAYAAGSAGGGPANPAYASGVLGLASRFESGPLLYAWPVGGQQTKGLLGFIGGGTWLAPALASQTTTWVIVTAEAPLGSKHIYGNRPWRGLRPPTSLSASVNGSPATVQPSASAPRTLAQLTPPDSAYWWLPVPVSTSATARVEVSATWTHTVTIYNTVPYTCGHETCFHTVHYTQTQKATAATTLGVKGA